MKSLITIAVLIVVAAPAFAQLAKPCEELKAEIAKKMEANKVRSYSLEIVATEQVKEGGGKVVGSCDGGTKKIVYRRTSSPTQTPASTPSKN